MSGIVSDQIIPSSQTTTANHLDIPDHLKRLHGYLEHIYNDVQADLNRKSLSLPCCKADFLAFQHMLPPGTRLKQGINDHLFTVYNNLNRYPDCSLPISPENQLLCQSIPRVVEVDRQWSSNKYIPRCISRQNLCFVTIGHINTWDEVPVCKRPQQRGKLTTFGKTELIYAYLSARRILPFEPFHAKSNKGPDSHMSSLHPGMKYTERDLFQGSLIHPPSGVTYACPTGKCDIWATILMAEELSRHGKDIVTNDYLGHPGCLKDTVLYPNAKGYGDWSPWKFHVTLAKAGKQTHFASVEHSIYNQLLKQLPSEVGGFRLVNFDLPEGLPAGQTPPHTDIVNFSNGRCNARQVRNSVAFAAIPGIAKLHGFEPDGITSVQLSFQ